MKGAQINVFLNRYCAPEGFAEGRLFPRRLRAVVCQSSA